MTQVYIIRHAEAEGNLYRRIHGWYDSQLTEFGKFQVEMLRKRFENIRFDAVYASDRIRTCETAQSILKDRDIPLITSEKLREHGMGVWEDMTWGEAQLRYPQAYYLFNHDPAKYAVDGCESYENVQKRMMEFLLETAAENDGKTIAIFSHGAAIRIVQATILGVPSNRITEVSHGDNTSVTKLNVENGNIEIEYLNDASHLGEMTRTHRQTWWKTGGDIDTRAMWYEEVNITTECDELRALLPELDTDSLIERLALGTAMAKWAVIENNHAGVVILDLERDKEKNIGFIEAYAMKEAYIGDKLAVQLLGEAVSIFRDLGRRALAIEIPRKYADSVGFFEHFTFRKIAEGDVIRLEKDIC